MLQPAEISAQISRRLASSRTRGRPGMVVGFRVRGSGNWSMEYGAGSREQGAGSREQGVRLTLCSLLQAPCCSSPTLPEWWTDFHNYFWPPAELLATRC